MGATPGCAWAGSSADPRRRRPTPETGTTPLMPRRRRAAKRCKGLDYRHTLCDNRKLVPFLFATLDRTWMLVAPSGDGIVGCPARRLCRASDVAIHKIDPRNTGHFLFRENLIVERSPLPHKGLPNIFGSLIGGMQPVAPVGRVRSTQCELRGVVPPSIGLIFSCRPRQAREWGLLCAL